MRGVSGVRHDSPPPLGFRNVLGIRMEESSFDFARKGNMKKFGGSAETTASPFQIFGALLLTHHSLFARLWKYLMRKYGRVAEWLGTGLQNPLLRFNSGRDLTQLPRPPASRTRSVSGRVAESCRQAGVYNISGEWWNGIHATLKMLCQKHEGSSPSSPT